MLGTCAALGSRIPLPALPYVISMVSSISTAIEWGQTDNRHPTGLTLISPWADEPYRGADSGYDRIQSVGHMGACGVPVV